MLSQRVKILTANPLFLGLGLREVEALARVAVEKRFAPGEVLFHEGEECQGMYLIGRGRVRIYKTSEQGREVTIALEAAPSTVAELPVFDGGPYPASVSAVDEVEAILLGKRDFLRVCRQFPDIPMRMLAVIGKRLRQLVTTLEGVTFGSIRQRLARLLLELREEAGADSFALALTHQDLASRLGTVREVISRNLSRFVSQGLIRTEGRQFHVLNRGGLEAEAETEM